MAMVCPRCATTHEQRLQCPTCGGRLQFFDAARPRPAANSSQWQHTPWGRILIGLLLAQGLFHGLRHFAAGVLLAAHTPQGPPDEWTVLYGLVLTQALRAVTLVAGAILAGGGQRNGAALGAVLGVWNGVLSGLAPHPGGPQLSAVALYGEPLLQATLGALAGWLGSSIWRPLPAAEARAPLPGPAKAAPRPREPVLAGRVAWVRVLLGAALAVCGTLSAAALFNLLARLGEGRAEMGTLVDQVLTWEIKALALLAGGALAGFNTRNGLKQGMFVGIATTLVLSALAPRFPGNWLHLTGLLFVGTMGLCLTGGWFGSQLFPPVLPYKRRGLGPASMV